ncbi:MAG: alpha/beta fold hydrolase [Chloroflexota bacterium]|jgi:carboxylesterase
MPDANIASLGLFQGEEHQPFLWPAGQPAALLLHGFMGTPDEMRPLGQAFRQAGWTVQGLLLPGFGSQLESLFERRYQEWIEATAAALTTLQADHHPVLLAGYSMGAAVALNVAAQQPPAGLLLAAPFWRVGTSLQRLIFQLVKRIFRRPQPFKRANLTDPRLREFFGGLLPELDLEDPATQNTLRQLRVPTSFADQVFGVGKAAGEAANHVSVPTMIVQGIHDEAVRPAVTRQLLQAFPGPVQYVELPADHELVRLDNPGFPGYRAAALRFASDLVT